MFNVKVTRRQFLKWLSASAAALGLSQTDLLKMKKAFAESPPPDPGTNLCRVIWVAGAACSGCPTSLLNYLANPEDPELVLNQIANYFSGIEPLSEYLSDVDGDGHIDIAEV